MISLSRILLADRAPSSAVARRWSSSSGHERVMKWADFRDHVAHLAGRLEHAPAGPCLVEVTDPYALAVSLFALWNVGRCAVLPPNLQPGSLEHLANRTAGVLSDRPGSRTLAPAIDPLDAGSERSPLRALDRDALALELFSSGSTGDEKRIPKRLRHLEDEVDQLEELWGPRVDRAAVLSTASPHHLYGLLFGVLWPLVAGRLIHAQPILRPSEVVEGARVLGECTLVSVPAHLRRLAQHRNVAALEGRCRAIFSSGGPLSQATAHAMAGATGVTPIEALGSTETGGIAWRAQRPGDARPFWNPFPKVEVSCSPETGTARVRSPFVSVGAPDFGFTTADLIELLPEGRFLLHGRSDRIVKVGEKRLDLSAMESDLRTHDLVADAALLLVDRAGESRVAAVLVLTPGGERLLCAEGRRVVTVRLAEHLGRRWDPVLVPRLWRTVSTLPETERGKRSIASLRALFEPSLQPPPASLEDRPEVLETVRDATSVQRRCRVPESLSCWPGHFPGAPVVPGVLQIDWAMDAASALLGDLPRIREMDRVTFREPLRPGDGFWLRVDLEENGWIRFRIWGEHAEHTSGHARAERPGLTG